MVNKTKKEYFEAITSPRAIVPLIACIFLAVFVILYVIAKEYVSALGCLALTLIYFGMFREAKMKKLKEIEKIEDAKAKKKTIRCDNCFGGKGFYLSFKNKKIIATCKECGQDYKMIKTKHGFGYTRLFKYLDEKNK